MKRHASILLLFIFALIPNNAYGEPIFDEEEEPPRRERRTQTPSEDEAAPEPQILPTRRSRPASAEQERRYQRPRYRSRGTRLEVERPIFEGLGANSVSVLVHTPLISENTYDRRFASIGGHFLFSGSLARLGESAWLHGELGAGFTLSRLSALPLVDTFTHIYFQVPFRLRLLIPVSRNSLTLEFILGFHVRLFEYDSRPTTDGGFHFVTGGLFQNLDGNFGLGLGYRLSDSLKLRIVAEFINLSAGLEF